MLKEVINKNKAAFEYWLSGGAIWRRNCHMPITVSEWVRVETPDWTGLSTTYVEDDVYAEFRMALADGQEIQLNDGTIGCPNWNTAYPKRTPFSIYPAKFYRVKPDAPKFKVGDWVKYTGRDGVGSMQPIGQVINIRDSQVMTSNIGYSQPATLFKAWEPEKGDWCWFSDGRMESPVIKQFTKIGTDGKRYGAGTWFYKFCEPFIGKLPSFVKEQAC